MLPSDTEPHRPGTHTALSRRLVIFIVVFGLAVSLAPSRVAAADPIPTSTVVQQGLTIPWDLAFTPDGRMLVTERAGRIRVYASAAPGAALLSTHTIPAVRAEHESGVNGIAVDVDFATTGFVYVCAARDADGPGGPAPWVNELLRYRLTPGHQLVEQALIPFGPSGAQAAAYRQHNGCSVEIDAVGHLWVGIGDAGVMASAQDPNALNGKILRITRDGQVPADNPVMPGAAEATAVFSMGHRNPQGIAFEPGTGRAFASEHGPSVNDEINIIAGGANYGWPCFTGASTPLITTGPCAGTVAADFSAPAWASGSFTIATSGMTFLDHPMWDTWNGSPVVAQLKEQDVRRFIPGAGGTLTQADLLLDGQFGRLRAAVRGPDGALYLTTSNGSDDRVLRVVPGPVSVERWSGADRYATAATIASQTFPAGVPVAYVATGSNYPDALSGGAAAGRNGGPVLLVKENGIPAATQAELARLSPFRIVVLGGTAAVSAGVAAALDAYDAGGGVSRLFGADRYATAAAVSRATFSVGVPVAYVATGADYPDALAAVPAATVGGGPILLVKRDSVPAATDAELARLRPGRIVVLGGNSAISAAVANSLQRHTSTGIQRISGADRYETAAALSSRTFAAGTERVFVATGQNFPDGLTGGAASGFARGPLLLVPGTSLPASVQAELLRLEPHRVTILGGTSAVTDAVRGQIEALLNP